MNANEEMLAMLMLVILLMILILRYTDYADRDSDLCTRIMPLCC